MTDRIAFQVAVGAHQVFTGGRLRRCPSFETRAASVWRLVMPLLLEKRRYGFTRQERQKAVGICFVLKSCVVALLEKLCT